MNQSEINDTEIIKNKVITKALNEKVDKVIEETEKATYKAETALISAEQAEINAKAYTDEKVQLAYVTIGREANLYTDEKIGDIETALDGIIAMQNSLIGGSV